MNTFGGDWTERKIEIVVAYAKAYLTIMNKYRQFKCIYFDGFAGSGDIYKNDCTDIEIIKGAAIRILEIDNPKSFDIYYFVELDHNNQEDLKKEVERRFPHKMSKTHVVQGDCNAKMIDLAGFLEANKKFRALAFIDPYGMSLNWSSIQALKNLGVDLWILVPTGIGVNRMLTKSGDIQEGWLKRLEKFLGLDRAFIMEYFYQSRSVKTLFGDETITEKDKNAVDKAGLLYQKRLKEVFRFVSNSFALKNSTGSIVYHFMMASNNKAAFHIANDIIKPRI